MTSMTRKPVPCGKLWRSCSGRFHRKSACTTSGGLGISRTTLIFDVEVPYDFPMADGELLDEIQARLKALNPGYRGIITVDHDYVPRLPEQREKEGEKQ